MVWCLPLYNLAPATDISALVEIKKKKKKKMPPFMRTLLASAWSFFSFFTSEGVLQSQQQRTTSVCPSSIQESSPWYGETPLPDLFQISSSHSRDDDIYGHGIFGRDVCSDAFGPDAANSQCAPSMTLCCRCPSFCRVFSTPRCLGVQKC